MQLLRRLRKLWKIQALHPKGCFYFTKHRCHLSYATNTYLHPSMWYVLSFAYYARIPVYPLFVCMSVLLSVFFPYVCMTIRLYERKSVYQICISLCPFIIGMVGSLLFKASRAASLMFFLL